MKQYLNLLIRLRNRYLMGLDLLGLAIIPSLAMMLRVEDLNVVNSFEMAILAYTIVMIFLKTFAYYGTGLYSHFWAYASVHEMVSLIGALAVGTALEFIVFYGFLFPYEILPQTLPRSIPIISALLTIFWITASRMGMRIAFMVVDSSNVSSKRRRVIIVGAGVAGTMTAKELMRNLQMGLEPVGFVDDDRLKQGRLINGIRVCGTLSELPEVLKLKRADEVIIAMPTVSGKVVRDIVQKCRASRVPSKTIPALYDILRGTAKVDQVRAVQLEDLLRREVITSDTTPVMLMITGSRVLVTGAGGSIGSELCRQIVAFHPSELILLGHGETSVFNIMKELGELSVPDMNIIPVIADVRDRDRMEKIFEKLRPEVVFHAAAHKHVYLMQENIPEAVTNNVMGTRNLVELSDRFDVRRFVMVSSDKAVNPTSIMGVTKRIAELVVQDTAKRTGKAFVTVRFGNVLGSRGSVVPLFKRQIANGGPVTITDPNMTRYFMTIPEAVQLVLQSATMGEGGEVFVLDMGEQLKVIDIARDLIRLSGYEEEDIEIKVTGLIAGEKMFEELFYESDRVSATTHPKIMVCRDECLDNYVKQKSTGVRISGTAPYDSRLHSTVSTLIEAAQQELMPVVIDLFYQLVPQYEPTVAGAANGGGNGTGSGPGNGSAIGSKNGPGNGSGNGEAAAVPAKRVEAG